MEPLQPFVFIKSAEALDEDHELFQCEVEETIQRLSLPYNFAMALRVSQAKVSEERKQFYVEEMKEKAKGVVEEQAELQRRFMELCNDMAAKEEYDAKVKEAQEAGKVILSDNYEQKDNSNNPIVEN